MPLLEDERCVLVSNLPQPNHAHAIVHSRFNSNRTLITLTWDECEIGNDDINQIYVLALGKAVPERYHGTQDGSCVCPSSFHGNLPLTLIADYNHYSQLSTVEENWDLGNLGQGDVHANVYEFLTKEAIEHANTDPRPAVPGVGPYIVPDTAAPGAL